MKDLQEATEKIVDLKGETLAIQAMFDALIRSLPFDVIETLAAHYTQSTEAARVMLINSDRAGDTVISAFDYHSASMASMIRLKPPAPL